MAQFSDRQFSDRIAAGQALGALLSGYRGRKDVLVLGLPRGGVPVAFEVAEMLGAPLDVLVVRKLGALGQPELAAGAIASGGITVLNEGLIGLFEEPEYHAEIVRERAELRRREALYRNDRLPLARKGRTIILVDDGAATGSSMRAAIQAARKAEAQRVVAAIPVASPEALRMLREAADEVVCVLTPEFFTSVGEWYRAFDQTSDTEVATLLAQAHSRDERRRS